MLLGRIRCVSLHLYTQSGVVRTIIELWEYQVLLAMLKFCTGILPSNRLQIFGLFFRRRLKRLVLPQARLVGCERNGASRR